MSLTELQKEKFFDYSGSKPNKSIAVFCWSRTQRGTPLWDQAQRVGYLAASKNFTVITGGYGGSMEAVSYGAREALDGTQRQLEPFLDEASEAAAAAAAPKVTGILVPGQFPDRDTVGNRFLTHSIDAPNFPRRVEMLTSESRYYVVLPGTLGTLQEFVSIWILSVIHHPSLLKPVIIAFRDPWESVVQHLAVALKLPQEQVDLVKFADTPEDVMRIVEEDEAALAAAKK